jgi:uncharacterized protein (TIGR02145 family)
MPDDKPAAGKIRCQGIKPSHALHLVADDHFGNVTEKIKSNSAWGITSFILPRSAEYTVNNSFELAGWATHPNSASPDYIKGALFETDQSEVNLYAVWRGKRLTLNDITYMQEMSREIISNTPAGTSKRLIDSRDNKKYWVTKFGGGFIMMTQNLDFDIPSSYTYSRLTSDVISDKTYTKSSAGYDLDGGEYYFANGTTQTAISDFTEDDERWHYHIGNYYSPYNAKLATYSESAYTNVQQSVCPRGWGIPTAKELSDIDDYRDSMYLVKGGYIQSRDIVTNKGTTSRYLLNDFYEYYSSRTWYEHFYYTDDMRYSNYTSGNYYYGYSLRCIARGDVNINSPGDWLYLRQESHD